MQDSRVLSHVLYCSLFRFPMLAYNLWQTRSCKAIKPAVYRQTFWVKQHIPASSVKWLPVCSLRCLMTACAQPTLIDNLMRWKGGKAALLLAKQPCNITGCSPAYTSGGYTLKAFRLVCNSCIHQVETRGRRSKPVTLPAPSPIWASPPTLLQSVHHLHSNQWTCRQSIDA